jgi:hypothetical protein
MINNVTFNFITKMSQSIKSIIKSFDSYEDIPQFNINGQTNMKSFLGGILSLTSLVFFLGILFYNFGLFISNNEPSAITTRQYRNTSEIEVLPKQFFNISLAMVNLGQRVTPSNLKSKSALFASAAIDLSKEQTLTTTPIGMFLNCSETTNQWFNDYQEVQTLFNLLGQGNGLCSQLDPSKDLKVGGNILKSLSTNALRGAIQYDLCGAVGPEACTNSTILNSLPATGLGILFENAYTNLTEELGFTNFLDLSNSDINLGNDYIIEFTVTKNIMSTDINPIYSFVPNVESVFYTLTKTMTATQRPPRSKDLTVTINVLIDDYQYAISRSYIKIDSVLANVLSITQIIALVCQYINSFFSFAKIEYTMMTKLYEFPITDDRSPKEAHNMVNIAPRVKNEHSLGSHGNEQQGVLMEPSSFKRKFERRKLKKNPLLLLYDMFPSCVSKKNINTILLLKGAKMISHEMNLIIMLKKLIEYEKLRDLLLSDTQLQGLLFIGNRVIEEKFDEDKVIEELSHQYNIKYDEMCINNYRVMYDKLMGSQDIVDNKLFIKIK